MQGDLDTTGWRDWLLSQLPPGIGGLSLVKPECIFGSHSALGVFSLPVALWDVLPERSAYKFISFVTTPNLVTQITDSSSHSVGDHADVDHTAPVQPLPVKLEESSSNVAPPMASIKIESPITDTVSSQTSSRAHGDAFSRNDNNADSLVSIFDLARMVVKLYSALNSRFGWYSRSYRLDDHLLNTCLLIEGKRLQLWARLWHLDHEDLTEPTLDDRNRGILSSFELILRNMLDLFRRIPYNPSSKLVEVT